MVKEILFRMHRGGLKEAMKTVQPVKSLDEIYEISGIAQYGIENKLKINHYCFDSRINWDTYIVTCEGFGVIGFTNGDLK
jgi:hypothetical protein